MDEPATRAHRSEPTPRWAWSTLGAVTLFAAALRFYELGKESLWLDEFYSWDVASGSLASLFEKLGAGLDLQPPAYHLSLHMLLSLVGDSEWGLRFSAALFGTLTVPMVFLVARRLYTFREALAAACITAVVWWPLDVSRNARPYAMLMFASGLCAWLLLLMVERIREKGAWSWTYALLFALAALLCCYTHYFGGLLVAFFALYGLAGTRRFYLRWLAVFVLIAVGYLPWLFVFLNLLAAVKSGGAWIPRPALMDLPAYVFYLFNHSAVLGCVTLGLFLVLAVVAVREIRSRATGRGTALLDSPGFFLLVWLAGPPLAAFGVSFVFNPVFMFRYLAISALPAYLLLARALFCLPVAPRLRACAAVLAPAALLIHTVFGLHYFARPWHAQMREAAEYVARHEPDANGVVLGYIWGTKGFYYDYYFERAGSPLRVTFGDGPRELPRLAAYLEQTPPPRLWFVMTNGMPEPELLDCLKQRMVAKERIRFYEAEVWLYVPRAP